MIFLTFLIQIPRLIFNSLLIVTNFHFFIATFPLFIFLYPILSLISINNFIFNFLSSIWYRISLVRNGKSFWSRENFWNRENSWNSWKVVWKWSYKRNNRIILVFADLTKNSLVVFLDQSVWKIEDNKNKNINSNITEIQQKKTPNKNGNINKRLIYI